MTDRETITRYLNRRIEVATVRESALEAVSCNECGNGNALTGADEGCEACNALLDACATAGYPLR